MGDTNTNHETAPVVQDADRTREQLRALLLSALQAAAEGTALVPPKPGTYKLPDGTTVTRRGNP